MESVSHFNSLMFDFSADRHIIQSLILPREEAEVGTAAGSYRGWWALWPVSDTSGHEDTGKKKNNSERMQVESIARYFPPAGIQTHWSENCRWSGVMENLVLLLKIKRTT